MREFDSASRNRNGLRAHLEGHPHPGGCVVCTEGRWIYMKPAKTAGTSLLRGVFQNHFSGLLNVKDRPREFRDWLVGVSDGELASYFIFAVIRNPWDRLVSAASHFRMSIEDFLREWEAETLRPRARQHALPLHLYTHLNGRPFVDWAIDFESLDSDFSRLAGRLGFDAGALPHRNASQRQAYPAHFTEVTRAQAAKIYAEDIRLLDYRFDEQAGRSQPAGWLKNLVSRLKA